MLGVSRSHQGGHSYGLSCHSCDHWSKLTSSFSCLTTDQDDFSAIDLRPLHYCNPFHTVTWWLTVFQWYFWATSTINCALFSGFDRWPLTSCGCSCGYWVFGSDPSFSLCTTFYWHACIHCTCTSTQDIMKNSRTDVICMYSRTYG